MILVLLVGLSLPGIGQDWRGLRLGMGVDGYWGDDRVDGFQVIEAGYEMRRWGGIDYLIEVENMGMRFFYKRIGGGDMIGGDLNFGKKYNAGEFMFKVGMFVDLGRSDFDYLVGFRNELKLGDDGLCFFSEFNLLLLKSAWFGLSYGGGCGVVYRIE